MATSFPGGQDAWSNPTSTTNMDDTGYEHDLAHTNINDAVEAIEAAWFATLGLEWPTGALGDFQCQGGGTTTGQNHVVGKLSATPMNLPHPVTITEVRVYATNGGLDNTLRIGFYNRGGSNGPTNWGVLSPGALIATAGTVNASTSGSKIITGLSISLPAGISWFAWLPEGTQTGVWTSSLHTIGTPSTTDWNIRSLGNVTAGAGGTSHKRGLSKTGVTTGSLPDPWPTGSIIDDMTAFGWFATDSS